MASLEQIELKQQELLRAAIWSKREHFDRSQRLVLRQALANKKVSLRESIRSAAVAYNDNPSDFLQGRIKSLQSDFEKVSHALLNAFENTSPRHNLSSVAYFDANKNRVPFSSVSPQKYIENRLWERSQARTNNPEKRSAWDFPNRFVSPLESHVRLDVHHDMIKIKAVQAVTGLAPAVEGGGIRGEVRGFSRASHKRMIEFMAKIRTDSPMLFLTLTYPDEFPDGQPDKWKANFEAFRRRFERRFPYASAIWRLELKDRKSGGNFGKIAPHNHLIIVLNNEPHVGICEKNLFHNGRMIKKTVSVLSETMEEWASQAWFEIVGSDDEKHKKHGAFCVALASKKRAYRYISKYIAKEDNDNFSVGRRWGRIGKFEVGSSASVLLTKAEYIELLRMLRGWLKSRARTQYKKLKAAGFEAKFSEFYKRLGADAMKGCSVFGIGDKTFELTVFLQRCLMAVADYANLPYRTIYRGTDG